MQRFKKAVFVLITIATVAVTAEFFAFVCWAIMPDGYFAPKPTRQVFAKKLKEQYDAENFDPNLGWLPLKRDREASGARISPNNPVAGRHCLSLYGDSFVFGDEVDHVAAWGNQLAKKINCVVSNFGVGGYGTDQAYLRFAHNSTDTSSVVILGILSENIVRNVNQNRAFLYTSGVGPLKPVLWLDDARKIHFLPTPTLSIDSYDEYIKSPRSLFPKEFFIPDSSFYAEQRARFPYLLSWVNALRYKRHYHGILFYITKDGPWYRDFYDPSHPSRALQVTESIVDNFVEVARRRGMTPVIMFLATSRDISDFLKRGKWVYRTLYDRCKTAGYNCFDAGAALVEELGASHINNVGLCEYFCSNRFSVQGHYNDKGNRVLADVSRRYLRDFLPEARWGN